LLAFFSSSAFFSTSGLKISLFPLSVKKTAETEGKPQAQQPSTILAKELEVSMGTCLDAILVLKLKFGIM